MAEEDTQAGPPTRTAAQCSVRFVWEGGSASTTAMAFAGSPGLNMYSDCGCARAREEPILSLREHGTRNKQWDDDEATLVGTVIALSHARACNPRRVSATPNPDRILRGAPEQHAAVSSDQSEEIECWKPPEWELPCGCWQV